LDNSLTVTPIIWTPGKDKIGMGFFVSELIISLIHLFLLFALIK